MLLLRLSVDEEDGTLSPRDIVFHNGLGKLEDFVLSPSMCPVPCDIYVDIHTSVMSGNSRLSCYSKRTRHAVIYLIALATSLCRTLANDCRILAWNSFAESRS